MEKKNTKEWVRMLKFVLFSASAGIIQIGSFTLLNECTEWRYWPCYLISLLLSILWNFTFNRRFTFKSNENITRAMLLVLALIIVDFVFVAKRFRYEDERMLYVEN